MNYYVYTRDTLVQSRRFDSYPGRRGGISVILFGSNFCAALQQAFDGGRALNGEALADSGIERAHRSFVSDGDQQCASNALQARGTQTGWINAILSSE